MLAVMRQLDWSTPLRKADLLAHWRVLICVIVASVAGFLVWRAAFAHVFWFEILWSGGVTGGTAGAVIGGMWHLSDGRRRPTTSGLLLAIVVLGWGCFSAIAILLERPDMAAQERERTVVRGLDAAEVRSITVRSAGREPQITVESGRIAALIALTRNAELFSPSHEGAAQTFSITLERTNGPALEYAAKIYVRHLDDIVLDFHGYFVWHQLLIPGGREWLEGFAPPR